MLLRNFILIYVQVTEHNVKRGTVNLFSFVLLYCKKILLLTSGPVTLTANKAIKMKFFKQQNIAIASFLKIP